MALEYYQAFREPSPYEQERLKAERLRRYAELLEQQGGEPEGEFTYQGIRAMPSPAAALGKMLQAYQSKKAREKAEEAEAKSRQADIEGYESLQRELAPRQQVAAPTTPEIAASVGMPQINEEGAVSYQPGQQAPMRTEMVSPSVRERDDMLMRAMATGTPTAQRYAQLMLSRQPQVSIEAIMEASPESRKKYQETGDPFELAKPSKAADMPSDVQSYQYYVQQETASGRPAKTFEQWKAGQKSPPVSISLGDKGSQLGQEFYLKKIDTLSGPATNANRIVNQVAAMEDATKKGTFTGALAPNAIGAAQFLSSFGIDVKPDTLANSRAFQAASNQLVLDFMAANGGARGFTEKETAILQDAFPKIVDSPQARTQIASLLRRRAKQDVTDYNRAVETFRKAYPNSVIPYETIPDADARYEEWKRSQGLK